MLRLKRLLFTVMIIVITFCCVEIKAYYNFTKNSSVDFTTASYSNLTLSSDKTTYGICNQEPTLTLTVANTNAYNVIYTLSFSDSNLTYEIDGASGASYTVLGGGSKTHTIVLSGSTTSTSLTVTVNATLPYKSSHTKTVTLDISCPSSSITSTNNVAASQTATLTCSDTEGLASYYWGIKSSPATSEYTSQTSNLSTTKTVSAAGTYYLICKDKNGNTSTTSKTFYKTTLTMNKGTVSPTSVITMSGNSFTLPTPTASTGYTNKGAWYTSTAYSTSAGNYGASYKPVSSTTLYSTATANTYSIGYTLNGGTNGTNKPASGTYDSLVTLSNPTKTFTVNITNNVSGATVANNATSASSTQTFAGWTSTTVGSNAKTGTTTSPATAWTGSSTKNTYFKNLRESGTVTMVANWTAVAVPLPTVTKTGYTCGYTTSSTGTSIVHKSGASYTPNTTTASATLYVVCTANTYTIEYYTYNGGTKLGSSSHTYGAAKSLTTMETLGGSAPNTSVTFYGWATSANGTSRSYTDGQSVTSLTSTANGTVKLYAIYSKTVTVTFNANGCTTAAGSATGTIYNAGTTVSVTVPTATLNTTWKNLKASTSSTADTASSGTAVGSALSISVGSTSKTATAYYICNKTATVTFNANNCTIANQTVTFVVKNGGTSGSVVVPTAAMNSGWTTLGASSSATSTSQGTAMGSSMSVSIGTSSSGTNRYYNCIKAAVTKNVTYNKGSNVSAIGATSDSCVIAAVYNGAAQGTSCTVTLPSITANTGYTSVGWNTTNGATSGTAAGASYSLSSSSTTLYGNATANTYTVEYYTYNGETKLGSSTHTYGTAKNLTTMSALGGSAPNTSVSFYGWSTSANGTSRSYTDGQSVSNLTTTANGTIKLYAIYSKSVTVTFNSNGCTTAAGSATGTIYNAGTTVSVNVPSATLNTGWSNLKGSTSSSANTASTGTAVGSAISVSVGSTSKTATAYYICNKTVTVKFNKNNCTTADTSATFTVINGGTSGSVTVPSATMNSGWTSLGASTSTSSTSNGTAMGSSMSITGVGSSTTSVNRYYNCSKAAVTKSVTYSKGSNVSAIGKTSDSCTIAAVYNGATQSGSCIVTLPSITANTGYTAVGWNTSSGATSGTAAGASYSLSSSSTTLYGNAIVNTYTVEYYTYNGGTKLGSSTHTYGTAKNLTTMSVLGGSAPNTSVSFYGWATSANGTSRSYTDGQSVSNLTTTANGTIKLYAIYRSAGVTITYKSGVNNATSTTSSTYYYYNAATSVSITLGTPADITSWSKLGWRDDTSIGVAEYNSATAYNFSASKTLYGVYSRSYAAIFYSGVSKETQKTKSSTLVLYNSNTSATPTTVSITLDTAANSTDITNWTEIGWRDDTTAGAKEYDYGATVTVAWGTNFYSAYLRTLTISYNANNGSGTTASTQKTIYLNTNSTTTSSQAVTLASNNFSRNGYTFSKWAAGSTSGTQYAAGASYTAGVAYNASTFGTTMYAVWSANKIKLTLDPNGGSGGTTAVWYYYGTSTFYSNEACTTQITAITRPTRTGHTFVHYYGDGSSGGTNGERYIAYDSTEFASDLATDIYKDATMYAKWNVNSYTVTYSCSTNGGSGNTTASVAYGGAIDLTKTCTPASGWTFVGWNTSSTATSKIGSATMSTSNVTLYAVYKKEVTVTFNANGCTTGAKTASATLYNGATSTSVTVPSATLNTSWSNLKAATSSGATSGTAAGSTLSGISVGSTATTGTAYYICNKTVTVTFNANGCTTGAKTASATLYNGATSASATVPSATLNTSWSNLKAATSSGATNGTAAGSTLSGISVGSTATTGTAYYICNKTVTVTFNANGCTTGAKTASATLYNGATSASATVPSATLNTSWSNLKASTSSSTNTASSGTAAGSTLSGISVGSTATTGTAYYICNKTVTVTFNANGCTTAAGSATFTLINGGTSGSVTVPSKQMNSGWTSLGASSSASSTSTGTAMNSSMSISSVGSSTTSVTRYYNCSKAAITRNVTYSKGSNVSAIGATSGSCTIAAVYNGASQSTSCTVTLPTITANTGYTAVGWSTTNGATSGTAAGSSYTLSANTTLYANAIDQTKPSCSFGDWSVSSINVDETATITVTCTDTGSGVSTTSLTSSSFTVSDTSALSISTVTTTSVTNGKSYTITVTGLNKTASPTITLKASQVSDVAGNGNNAVTSASISIVADTSGPDIEFNANSNLTAAKSQSSAVTVTDHSNITTIKYLWTKTAGASASSGTSFSTVNVKTVTETKSKSSDNGTWYLCVYAVDSRGNSTNKCSGAFVLDNASPNCTIANPICLIKGATFNAANYISCTDASTVTLSTSGTVTTSTPGSYSVTVTAKDSAGNSTSKSTTVYVYTKLTSDTVTSGDGLYKDSYTSNRYLYRGTSPSNYVTFNGSNNWRIVAVNPDGTYKLAYMTSLGNNKFHSSKTTSFSGSTLETYLSGTYYSSLNSTAQSYIVSSGYYYNGAFGAASSSDAMSANVATDRASAYTGKVALLSASDYILASTHASCTNYYYAYNKVSNVVPCSTNNYLFKSSGSHWWIMNGHTNGNSRLIGTDGNLKNLGATNSYAVYPVVTLKATTTFLGSGTSSNPYTICTSCLETGISTTTCSISASAYGTTNTLTINPSSTSGITYSWDNGVTYSSTKTKTVSAAGAYTAYIKDSTGKVNTCSITIKSRTEYLSRSCTGTKTYGSWSSGSTTYNSVSCSGYTGDYSRVVCGNTYVAKWRCDVISGFCYDESTGGTSSAQSSWTNCNNWCNGQQSAMAAPISCTCYPSRTYQTRTCSCSAWGAWDTTWSTTEIESSCSKEVQTRTTYGV